MRLARRASSVQTSTRKGAFGDSLDGRKNEHPKLVQELLGHATIAMTLDTYAHFLPSMGDQTVRAMEAALS
jgi:integrase